MYITLQLYSNDYIFILIAFPHMKYVDINIAKFRHFGNIILIFTHSPPFECMVSINNCYLKLTVGWE